MHLKLREPSPADLDELTDYWRSPCFVATSGVLDKAGIDLRFDGQAITALFEPHTEFEHAWAIVEDTDVELPADRVVAGTHAAFWTPEKLAEHLTEDELEYEAWAALNALALKRAETPPTAPNEGKLQRFPIEFPEEPQKGTWRPVPHDFMAREPRFLEPVGLLTPEELVEVGVA